LTAGAINISLGFMEDSYLHSPRPHRFKSVTLQSGVWSNKSIKELESIKNEAAKKFFNANEEYKGLGTDLKDLRKAKTVNAVAEESKNGPLKEMKEAYPSYFDEESGNTTTKGMNELENYLRSEISVYKNKRIELKKNYDEIKEALEAKMAVKDKINFIFPFITNSPTLFSVFLKILSFFIYFELIDIFIINFDMPEIVIPTIITSTVLLI
jgi:hypothetical protein